MGDIKAIAIHLPQFHPFAENDEWWGKGFTEWTNVTKAKPLFKGHYQPHLPSDLGFYDLRLEQSRVAQAELAKEYGIYGFCYYHYWFNAKRIMNKPLDDMLETQTPDFPFMLCWANENWTRRWDGEENEVLMKQDYSLADHREHALFLCETFFKDKRYITVEGKPVFVFYKAALIPDLADAITVWRQVAAEQGYPGLYILCMDNFIPKPAESYGFNGAIHFQPDYRYFKRPALTITDKIFRKLKIKKPKFKLKETLADIHHIEDYNEYNQAVLNRNYLNSEQVFPGITPGWDNTARKKRDGIIFKNSTPELYGSFLKAFINRFKPRSKEENFFFINAWNEWAEGNHLEPCHKYGRAYLEQTKQALNQQS